MTTPTLREALESLLSLIRRDAPHLSGKVIGDAEAALSAPTQAEPVGQIIDYNAGCNMLFEKRIPSWLDEPPPVGTKLYTSPPPQAEPADPNAPAELFLQLYGDSSADEGPVDYQSDEVSWCWHQVNGSDVRYVQAPAAAPKP